MDDFLDIGTEAVSGEVLPPDGNPLQTIEASPVKPRLMARQILDEMGEEADPIRHMLGVIKNPGQPAGRRMDAAKAAAPFIYPKLGAVAVAETSQRSIEDFINGLPEPD